MPEVPGTHWLLKTGLNLASNPPHFLHTNRQAHGDIYHVNLPFRAAVAIHKPEYIRQVLIAHNKRYIKDYSTKRLGLTLGQGLLVSDGDFWRRQRRIAQPAFHRQRLAHMADVMVELTQKRLDSWQGQAELDLSQEMMGLTAKIAAKTLFGTAFTQQMAFGEDLLYAMRFITWTFKFPFLPPLWWPSQKFRRFHSANKQLAQLIDEMIRQHRNMDVPSDDLLTMLMEARDEDTGEGMTDQQLRDESITLFSAGHETTANALTWTLYLLSKHPEIRDKARAHLGEVLQGRVPTARDVPRLTYLEQILSEAMRIYPPAWLIAREAVEEDEIAGHKIPVGTQIMISPYAMHRHEGYWPDPDRFDPDRFAPEQIKERPRFAYLPFGGGPRLCIGLSFAMMEMKLVLALILQQHTLALKPGHVVDLEPVITLRPRYGMVMLREDAPRPQTTPPAG